MSLIQLWKPAIITTALVFSIPLLTISLSFLQPSTPNIWQHLLDTVLIEYIINSLLLMVGVGCGTFFIGVTCAWLTSVYQFPGQRFFVWSLLLPLAMPAYIIAYTYTGMLDFAGPVQTLIRESTGWGYGDYFFPEIRSLGGAVTMLSFVLFPYVYLLARAAFLDQSVCVLEVSRTLGCHHWDRFYRVALPLARPAIIAGISLALMETLADYGTVSYFGLNVFTTGIFRVWFGFGDSVMAANLAAILLLFVLILVVFERRSRRQAQYHHSTNKYQPLPVDRLQGTKGWIAFFICLMPLLFGFLLPAAQLGFWAIDTYAEMVDATFLELTINTILLAFVATMAAALLALFLAYGKRIIGGKGVTASVQIVSMGYAIPGTIIAMGIIIPFAWFDNTLDAYLRTYHDISSGLLLSGSLFTVIFAYLVRFLGVSMQSIDNGLGRIKHSMDDAARSLGYSRGQVLYKVHWPMMKGAVLTALLVVFVDVMKELPATLILRPFNFNTLAVRTFELATDERLADASTAALMIVGAGLIPVILLSKSITVARAGS